MTRRVDLALHLVTDDRLNADTLLSIVDAAVDGGVTVVQLRDKRVTAAELIRRARMLSDVIAGRVPLLIDDRVDVALAAIDAGAAWTACISVRTTSRPRLRGESSGRTPSSGGRRTRRRICRPPTRCRTAPSTISGSV